MKKTLSIILALLMLLVTLPAIPAAAETSGDYTYELITFNTVRITEYNGPGGDVVIPSKLDDRTVTEIGNQVFRWNDSIVSITVPNGVTSIDYACFNFCSNLKSVSLPNSLTYIEASAFADCTSLESIDIPSGVAKICEGAFKNCESLKEVKLHDGLTIIEGSFYDGGVFQGCTSLKSIVIPETVSLIGSRAFEGCTSLEKAEILSAEKIEYAAFSDCIGLKEVQLPDNLTTIEERAFKNCSSLERIEIPDSVTEMGGGVLSYSVFEGCTKLKYVKLSSGLTVIERETFKDCTSLESLTIPEGVTTIGRDAFQNCKSLRSMILPESLTEIYNDDVKAFEGCPSNLTLYVKVGSYAHDFAKRKGFNLIAYEIISDDEVKLTECSIGMGTVTIPEEIDGRTITEIGSNAFADCSGITEVVIPESVTTIAPDAFEGYSSNFVIRSKAGSAAESFAKENGITFEEITDITLGDVNGDESIDAADATLVLQMYAGIITDVDKSVADVNGDSKADAADATLILQKYAGILTEF